jgi:large subunit ribosomal protein L7/L12
MLVLGGGTNSAEPVAPRSNIDMRPIVALCITAVFLGVTCLAVLAEGPQNLLVQAPNGELWVVADGVRHQVTPSKLDAVGLASIPAGESWPIGMLAPGTAEPVAEKPTCTVILEDDGDQKIAVIRAIRELTPLGLREAKELTEEAPSVVASGLMSADAQAMAARLREAGAKVTVKC